MEIDCLYKPLFTTISRTQSLSTDVRGRNDQDNKTSGSEVNSVHSCSVEFFDVNTFFDECIQKDTGINIGNRDFTDNTGIPAIALTSNCDSATNSNSSGKETSILSSAPSESTESDISLNITFTLKSPLNEMPSVESIQSLIKFAKNSMDPKTLFQCIQKMLVVVCWINMNPSNYNKNSLNKSLIRTLKRNLKFLIARKYKDAGYILADAYSSGLFGSVDNKKAFILFRNASQLGHIEATFRTAYCYERGLGVEASSWKALKYLEYAAKQKHQIAMFKLGMAYYYEKLGAPKNDVTKLSGVTWLTRAVDCSDNVICDAPYELGKIYATGYKDLILKDTLYSELLFRKAEMLGYSSSKGSAADFIG
ncbi:hypothetical protein TPHA_0E00910 [Tetrapisispora phaffii CBS 4417]|uniref:Activator of C kinase protein 1 n=1 Tax=Tetrapisispora phaffii (strain ATCC 24235 / CBS 4417 / NBRC 1672 / NRRL Y-8282 / UCD 70-5) TaxID=1071381 RepID=G8BTF7_TETPH|nr:hypothetical protein TPHA_0E00910 [Tetrapisispora phaffii CBS 4417]CCE63185.1 hypothetical protein TPHA_0E00910 [Tetrapisispora phaffii CBS 4417]